MALSAPRDFLRSWIMTYFPSLKTFYDTSVCEKTEAAESPGSKRIPKGKLEMEFDSLDRLSIIYLLRLYFDDDKEKNPLDNEKQLCVSHAVINVMADIIIYCYNPVLFYKYEEYTHIVAKELMKDTTLISNLPESIQVMIRYRSERVRIIERDLSLVCQQIITVAKQNYDYWTLRSEGKLEWGKCDINDIIHQNSYSERELVQRFRISEKHPFKKEGWLPVVLHGQSIYIPEGEYIHLRESDLWVEDTIKVEYNPDFERPISRITFNTPSKLSENDEHTTWKQVQLLSQRAWVYYTPEKFHLLPPKYDPNNFVVVTLSSSFESIPACCFFVERNPEDSPFRNYVDIVRLRDWRGDVLRGGQLLIESDDEEEEEEKKEVKEKQETKLENQNEKILVSGISLNHPSFQASPYIESNKKRFNVYKYCYINNSSRKITIKLRFLNTTDEQTWHNYDLDDILTKLGKSEMYDNINLFKKILEQINVNQRPSSQNNLICQYSLLEGERGTIGFFDLNLLLYIYLYKKVYDDDFDVANDFIESLKEIKEEIVPSKYKSRMPKDMVKMIVENALQSEAVCPITFEPLTIHNACILSCFHLYDVECIRKWLVNNNNCPLCRENIKWITEPVDYKPSSDNNDAVPVYQSPYLNNTVEEWEEEEEEEVDDDESILPPPIPIHAH